MKKSDVIGFRCSSDIREKVRAAAKTKGLSSSEYIRNALEREMIRNGFPLNLWKRGGLRVKSGDKVLKVWRDPARPSKRIESIGTVTKISGEGDCITVDNSRSFDQNGQRLRETYFPWPYQRAYIHHIELLPRNP